jgi:hypothetical protein
MKLGIDMHRTLAFINAALLNGDEQALQRAFEGVDLAQLLSQHTITVVRGLGKAPLVMLLCTLAEHNDVEAVDAKRWLACYQSIARESLLPEFEGLSTRHVRRWVLDALISRKPLSVKNLGAGKLKGSPLDTQEAFELLIDHKAWTSALTFLQYLRRQSVETEVWVRIASCLSSRHPLYVETSGLPQVDVDYRALAELYSLCADAAKQAKVSDVQKALIHLSASALETSGDHAAAAQILGKTDPHGRSVAVQMDSARCRCKQGDLLQSIQHLDRALELLAENPLVQEKEAIADSQETRPAESTSLKTFDVKKANKALSDLSEMANAKGTPVFLVSGTLLGCVREGQLLSHDKDIDVGIVGWENQYTLCMALQESGRFTVSAQHLKGEDTFYIPICHNATGMWIDIFVYHPQGEHLVTGVDFFFGYRQTFAFTPFELKDVEFLGVSMKIPVDAELNLTENYGQWRLPDPFYLSHLESPSTMNKGGLPYMLTARLSALSALSTMSAQSGEKQTKSFKKLSKVLTLMREHQHRPGGMSKNLLDQLSNRLPLELSKQPEFCLA